MHLSPFAQKLIGSVISVAAAGLAHSGVLPHDVPPAVVDIFAGLILGALHIPRPGDVKRPK
jgi:hypothetical protein